MTLILFFMFPYAYFNLSQQQIELVCPPLAILQKGRTDWEQKWQNCG